MAAKHPNMPAAREEYVTGDDSVTLEAISRKHHISIQAVRQHSMREKWVAQREQHREHVRTLTRKKAAEAVANIRVRQMAFGRMMQGKGAEKLSRTDSATLDVDQARHLIRDGADIERKAAGIEEQVSVLVKSELSAFLDRCERALTDREYRKVLALAASSGEDDAKPLEMALATVKPSGGDGHDPDEDA